MNAEYGDITRTSPEARRVNTCGVTAACASAIPSPPSVRRPPSRELRWAGGLSPLWSLPGGELMTRDLTAPDRDDQSPQHPLPVLAPRVEGPGPSVLRRAARLVDVAVEAHRRLVGRKRVGHRLAPGPVVNGLAVLDHRGRRPHRRVELHARVQARVERRTVEGENPPRRI